MSLPTLTDDAGLGRLAADLAAWLPHQRWYQDKARELAAVQVRDAARLSDRLLVLLVEARFADGGTADYHVPLAPAEVGALFELEGQGLGDALADPRACLDLARATVDGSTATLAGARLTARPITGSRPDDTASARALGAEQSNSSVVIDDAFVLKVLRRLETGIHPDVEVTGALTAAGFTHVPAQHGALVRAPTTDDDENQTALAILSTFLAGGREGWDLALAQTRALASGERTIEEVASEPDGLLGDIDRLGEVTADLHLTLGEAFGVEEADARHGAAWATEMRGQLDRVLALAEARAPEAAASVLAAADDLRAVFDELASLRDAGRLVRVHGDLHLGQVLRIPPPESSWQLLDFEGEPLKSLEERRARTSPLRDVAGMLRSFDYAAAASVERDGANGAEPPLAAGAWRDAARRRFLGGYVRRAGPLLPGATASQALLHAFELDKAVYELAYEIGNRPGWLAIPAGGILRVLRASHSARDPDPTDPDEPSGPDNPSGDEEEP
ncbi:aminoglycoside phosphotransferase [Egibacter rhizosphaerae]|uniref:Maltokinase n=1 Tax=Egibacter rhizosphaerae TaxID=1670831 RepID=A0A411YAF4_9ACTN|nr:phosphotransferase [Egibacter rhizosphaerae]QBI18200.1 aminoglycoside phosphotransferase [Egibacter rhizosphaerae]